MKYAIFTVSMPNSTPREAVAKIKAAGGHGVEWRVVRDAGDTGTPGFWSGNRCTLQTDWTEAQFREVAAITRDAGLTVPNLGTYTAAADLDEVEKMMGVAKLFGAPSLRVGGLGYDGATPYPRLLDTARTRFAKVLELGRKYGVKTLIEIHHGTIVPSASAAWRLVSAFSPEEIGVILDPGNMMYEGYENWQMGMEILRPYLAHVHVKSAMPVPKPFKSPQRLGFEVSWASPRAGAVDFARVFRALRSVGYDGWLSVEDFATGMDDEWVIRDSFAFLREMEAFTA